MPASEPPALPDVPGYVLTPGRRSDGVVERLSAVEQGSRRRVELVLLPALAADERDRITAVLDRYADVADDNLAAPVRLAEQADALVVPAAEHATLAGLTPPPEVAGQAVTVLAPVATAVAALHQADLAHGGIDAASVMVDADGRPRLGGAGVAAALHALAPREVAEPSVDADRDHVLSLCQSVAAQVGDTALTEVVDGLVAESARPAQVAAALLDSVEPVPLGPVSAASPPTPPAVPAEEGDESAAPAVWWRRPGPVVAAVLGVVAVGVVLWLALGGSDDSMTAAGERTAIPAPVEPSAGVAPEPSDAATATPTASPTTTAAATSDAASAAAIELCGAPQEPPEEAPELADDWAEVVSALYLRRSAALVTGQTSLLCEVYDPLSTGLVSDLELDAAYEDQGVRPDALVFVVEEATLVEQEGALLLVEVTDQLEPYRLVNASGETVAELDGIPSETWQARLVPDPSGTHWRFG
jgi:hypothetical protein